MPQQRDNGGVGEGRRVGGWGAFPSERDNKDRREKKQNGGKKRNAVSAMSNLQAPAEEEEERQSKLRLL